MPSRTNWKSICRYNLLPTRKSPAVRDVYIVVPRATRPANSRRIHGVLREIWSGCTIDSYRSVRLRSLAASYPVSTMHEAVNNQSIHYSIAWFAEILGSPCAATLSSCNSRTIRLVAAVQTIWLPPQCCAVPFNGEQANNQSGDNEVDAMCRDESIDRSIYQYYVIREIQCFGHCVQ